MSDKTESLPTIENNVRIALANSRDWITPSDNGAIATLLRLSRLIDELFNMGETKDLPPLLSRLTSLMEQLQLTPKSRADQDLTPKEMKSDGSNFQEAYLRIVGSSSKDNTGQGDKPRPASKRPSSRDGKASPTLAKKRPQ